MARQAQPRRYSREREWYERKIKKVMDEFGAVYSIRYDRWEGAALDFTYKGVSRRFERTIDKQTIHYASDCLAQIALGMEKLLWLKREGIFDLDILAAGLPELPAPSASLPDWCRALELDFVPESREAMREQWRMIARKHHPDTGGSPAAFLKVQQAKDEAEAYYEGR